MIETIISSVITKLILTCIVIYWFSDASAKACENNSFDFAEKVFGTIRGISGITMMALMVIWIWKVL
jgi:hypothetical protein